MAKKQQHLDEFLRDKLSELPNAPVAGFEKVEGRMAAKNHRGVALLVIIPLLITGLYWIMGVSEDELVNPVPSQSNTKSIAAPTAVEIVPAAPAPAEPVSAEAPITQQSPPASPLNKSAKVEVLRSGIAADEPLSAPASNDKTAMVTLNEPAIQAEPVNEITTTAILDPAVEEQGVSEEVFAEVVVVSADEMQAMPAQTVTANKVADVGPMFANTSRWSVLANFYPNYTFREFAISPDYKNLVHNRYEDIIRDSERGGFAFNVGLDVRYNLGKGIFLGSGLGYIEMKVNGRYNYKIYEEINMAKAEPGLVGKTESVTAYHAIPVDQGIVQTYRYLQVPLHISYQTWATSKLMLMVEGGMSYIRFLGADGTTIDYQTLVPVDVSRMNYTKNLASADFKVGFSYFISNQLAFGLQPSLMYFTNSIYTEESALSVVPWSVGVNFNVTMRLY